VMAEKSRFTEHHIPRREEASTPATMRARARSSVLMHDSQTICTLGRPDYRIWSQADGRRWTFRFLGFGASDKTAARHSFKQQTGRH